MPIVVLFTSPRPQAQVAFLSCPLVQMKKLKVRNSKQLACEDPQQTVAAFGLGLCSPHNTRLPLGSRGLKKAFLCPERHVKDPIRMANEK